MTNSSVMHFVKSSRAIEAGFIVAGVMVSIIAAVQTVVIALNWSIYGV